ncbi:MAG: DUF934 domain-containing protein [Alphaproteobacteria bacterium]|jgi:uncharacterized protein (DUF934 family)|nr:DUF934 domain-containing protein [Alphaproteobacteria bacterium]
MTLLKGGEIVADEWAAVGDDDPVPAGPAIVSLQRWQGEREELLRRNHPVGVRLASDEASGAPGAPGVIEEISADLDRLGVVVLEFASFTDGRAYSQARLLRERYGFEGEVRAVGNVLRDQYQFMLRCGFDAFEVVDPGKLDGWREAASEIGAWYQPAADRRQSIPALRHAARGRA